MPDCIFPVPAFLGVSERVRAGHGETGSPVVVDWSLAAAVGVAPAAVVLV